jgi:hypothetical protein
MTSQDSHVIQRVQAHDHREDVLDAGRYEERDDVAVHVRRSLSLLQRLNAYSNQ